MRARPGLLLVAALAPATASGQELEPRAYSPAPVGLNILGVAYAHAEGGAALDPALPFKNALVVAELPALYYVRTFSLFGREASAGAVLPYAFASASADFIDGRRAARRSGPGDPRLRLAVNLIGNPATGPETFAAREPAPSLGASLTVAAPFGQYYDKAIFNVGANRWAFRPDIGFSYPLERWTLELSTGAWLFTDNDRFRGAGRRAQDPIYSLQAHVGYTFAPGLWLALDGGYYAGGQTTANGVRNADRQETTRIGTTASLPLGESTSLKLAWSDDLSTRLGSGVNTWLVAVQFRWTGP